MRRAGVLMHITSLPGAGPCGTMGEEARQFVDFLHDARQSLWQVLPLTPPALYGSPYASYSVFAGNPSLIDLAELERQGALESGSVARVQVPDPGRVDFATCERQVLPLLRRAFEKQKDAMKDELQAFRAQHAFWLEDYALYMAIRSKQGDISYRDWPQLLYLREPGELSRTRERMQEQVDFWVYVQCLFFTQWQALRAYAGSRGISIMGDMPIYTADDSADVWANTSVFQLDARRRPTAVSGVPPDAFSADGQLWGNPLYDWDYLQGTGYRWWIERMRVAALLYDEVRIDHFRALDEYYAIPAGDTTARNGSWRAGPGIGFLRAVQRELPELRMVAEDLGLRTPGVQKLLKESGLPGMSVLQFAFDPWARSEYLPHNHIRGSVAYIGTHDNDTALGWIMQGAPDEVRYATEYLQLTTREGYNWGLMRGLYSSVADTAVVQMQDLLGLDNAARMNLPGTVGGINWAWRMAADALAPELSDRLGVMMARYGRQP